MFRFGNEENGLLVLTDAVRTFHTEVLLENFSTRERKLIVSDTDSVSIQVVTWNARNSDSGQTESGGQFRCAPEFRV